MYTKHVYYTSYLYKSKTVFKGSLVEVKFPGNSGISSVGIAIYTLIDFAPSMLYLSHHKRRVLVIEVPFPVNLNSYFPFSAFE